MFLYILVVTFVSLFVATCVYGHALLIADLWAAFKAR
jgi:hypothetical protein